jgi:taspase, threonine aspartase, 1
MGLEMVTIEQLISRKSINDVQLNRSKIEEFETSNSVALSPLNTVGAITIDDKGNIAAGCSSGSIVLKLSGRVGQAAGYGAGCWSQKIGNQSMGTCTTGNGKYLIKTLLALEICDDLYNCDCPATRVTQVFNEKFLKSPLLPLTQEYYGGCPVIDYNSESSRGELLWAHTLKMLCLGYKSFKMKNPKFMASSLRDASQAGMKVTVGGTQFFIVNKIFIFQKCAFYDK